jgi:hypothetical protein
LVAVVLLCTMASAVSQTTPVMVGAWRFTANSISNDPDDTSPPQTGQIHFKNYNVGADIHVHGKGTTGFRASRSDDSPSGPAIVLHKSRGSPANWTKVRTNDHVGGTLSFNATVGDPQQQRAGAKFECRMAAREPSIDDVHTRCRLSVVGPGSNRLAPAAEWDPAKGMLLYGRQVATQGGHLTLRPYTRAQVLAREVFPRPRGQLILVVDDPLHRGVAWSDGRYWRYLDGKVVN